MIGTAIKQRGRVIWIKGDDGCTYYGTCNRRIKPGTEVGFHVNQSDSEVADDVISFGINPVYSMRDNIISLLVGLAIGAAMVFFTVRPVHAASLSELPAEDITLVAKIVAAEAENQPFSGKKYVASVVLNRVESDKFPDSVEEVIYQDRQFSVIKNGAFDKAIPIEEDYEAVMQEVRDRSDDEILYFTAGGYGKSGKPSFKEGDHYFSK